MRNEAFTEACGGEPTKFSEILALSASEQERWRLWRNSQYPATPASIVVPAQACPLKTCKAAAGVACQSGSGRQTFHGSRRMEYFAKLWFQSQGGK